MDSKNIYKIERPVFSYEDLNNDFNEEDVTFKFLEAIKHKTKVRKRSLKSIGMKVFPFPFILASFYSFKFLLYDLVAGLTMLVFHIPQGMAYGLLSGLQPINGLYASFFPPMIYLFFATSRHLSLGTFSIMALLSSVPVLREANNTMPITNLSGFNSTSFVKDEYEDAKLQISIATTLLAGIFQIGLGFFQMGCIMNFLSDALIGGFTSATSVHVVVSQLSQVLGYSIKRYSGIGELPYKLFLFCQGIKRIHWPTVIISVCCIVILFVFTEIINPKIRKRFKFPIPIQLFIIIIATVISYYFAFSDKWRVKIVGQIPKGLPSPIVPDVTLWSKVVFDAALLAIIAFALNSALVKIYSLKFSYPVDFNVELVAYGMANIFGSFFQCTISAGALARSSVVVEVGMKSQIATLVSCFLMLFVLLFVGPLFESVPTCVLSCIIIVSLKGMFMQIKTVPELYRLSKYDFDIFMVSFLATIFFNVPYGLITGFIASLVTIVIRLQNPRSQLLGQLPHTDIYKSVKIYKDAIELPGLKIFRYDAPLYFANAEHFQMKLYRKSGVNPQLEKPAPLDKNKDDNRNNTNNSVSNVLSVNEDEKNENLFYDEADSAIKIQNENLECIILDFSSVNYVDNVAIRILDKIYNSYRKVNIRLFIAAPNYNIRRMLAKAKFAQENLSRIMFLTVHDAVLRTSEEK